MSPDRVVLARGIPQIPLAVKAQPIGSLTGASCGRAIVRSLGNSLANSGRQRDP